MRDGLSAINGSNVITAMGALLLHDAERWVKQAEIVAVMTLEALRANMKPYASKLHELRGFRGAVTCARNLMRVMEGSDLVEGVLCDHLAFSRDDTDWQVWIEAGERPVPRKLVITSIDLPGTPQFGVVITSFEPDVQA